MWPARARLAIARAGLQASAVSWPAASHDGDRARIQPVLPGAAGDLVAAPACGQAELEIADVIWRPRAMGPALPAAWLARTLDRYPGCAVVAMGLTGHASMAVAPGRPAITVTVNGDCDTGGGVLACAVFIYGWLASGWPAEALKPPRLEVSGTFAAEASSAERNAVAAIAFAMSYAEVCPASVSAGPGSPSRRRASSASGAPRPS